MATIRELVARGYTSMRLPQWHHEAYIVVDVEKDGSGLKSNAKFFDVHATGPATEAREVDVDEIDDRNYEPIGKSNPDLAAFLTASEFDIGDPASVESKDEHPLALDAVSGRSRNSSGADPKEQERQKGERVRKALERGGRLASPGSGIAPGTLEHKSPPKAGEGTGAAGTGSAP